jgi:hypothetical protein
LSTAIIGKVWSGAAVRSYRTQRVSAELAERLNAAGLAHARPWRQRHCRQRDKDRRTAARPGRCERLFTDGGVGNFPHAVRYQPQRCRNDAESRYRGEFPQLRHSASLRCRAEVADTGLAQGQDMHGNLSSGDTLNFMALAGPDHRASWIRPKSARGDHWVMNSRTAAHRPRNHAGNAEGAMPDIKGLSIVLAPVLAPPTTPAHVLDVQAVGNVRYLDAGAFRGRTLGLSRNGHPPAGDGATSRGRITHRRRDSIGGDQVGKAKHAHPPAAQSVACQLDELGRMSTMPTMLRPLIAIAILPSRVGIM